MTERSASRHVLALECLTTLTVDEQDQIIIALERLADAMKCEASIRALLMDDSVPVRNRVDIIKRSLGVSFTPALSAWFIKLVAANALGDLVGVTRHLTRARERHSLARAVEVVSAVPLVKDERAHLRTTLTKAWNTHVLLCETVDPRVLGGLQLRTEGWSFDATVAGRLQRLKICLLPNTPTISSSL